MPVIIDDARKQEITALVKKNIALAKADWDSFEISWDFVRHPLAVVPCADKGLISEKFAIWADLCEKRFSELKNNEEELNRIFIDVYGLRGELSPEVEDKDVTVCRADASREIRSFISYAVGCLFGRYSPDTAGVICASRRYDIDKYRFFPPVQDNIIPVVYDGGEEDITERFIKFVRTMYGAETLEENLSFIAGALGGSGSSREVIRKYFRDDFFADHCRIYQKRPVYWLFDSGKKGGFRALIYMHRCTPDTLKRMHKVYLHKQQEFFRTAPDSLTLQIKRCSGSEKVKLAQQQLRLKARAEEVISYEKKLHLLANKMIPIDIDEGVRKNYAIFQELLPQIR